MKVLNFSEGAAYKRITAARLARRYPVILEMVTRGDLHVSALNELAPHLTVENHRELLRAAARLGKRELRELIARWFPKPDAPTLLRKLPERAAARLERGVVPGGDSGALLLTPTAGNGVTADVSAGLGVAWARAGGSCAAGSACAGASCAAGTAHAGGTDAAASAHAGVTCEAGSARAGASPETAAAEGGPIAAGGPRCAQIAAGGPVVLPSRPPDRGSVAPLSPGRYRLQVTLSGQTRDKLVRAQELMRHVQPDGDLAVVLDRALSCLVQELEGRKFGKRKGRERAAKNPRAAGTPEAAGNASGLVAHLDGDAGESREAARRSIQAVDGLAPARAASSIRAAEKLAPARAGSGGKSDVPTGTMPVPYAPDTKDIPRSLRREVAERDGFRCSFIGPDGRRCEERGRLEYHHIHARALGGKTTADNLTLRCQAHNLADAVADFGADAVRGRAARRGLAARGLELPLDEASGRGRADRGG